MVQYWFITKYLKRKTNKVVERQPQIFTLLRKFDAEIVRVKLSSTFPVDFCFVVIVSIVQPTQIMAKDINYTIELA